MLAVTFYETCCCWVGGADLKEAFENVIIGKWFCVRFDCGFFVLSLVWLIFLATQQAMSGYMTEIDRVQIDPKKHKFIIAEGKNAWEQP